ncbi:hypothetical protein DFH06DRAFT_1176281 [Mycena polygramma]|nr:hypothetical protein DFH06DRAFT_1176281 [Mycena polygramma]
MRETLLHGSNHGPKASTGEKAGLAADRTRLATIDIRILQLEASTRREKRALQEERTVLQDRLDAYIYPVLTLPAEIVSEIFVHFLPGYPIRPPITGLLSPTVLSQICRTWREIALSTPALWRAVLAELPLARQRETTLEEELHAEAGQLCLLTAWLTRSRSHLLSIELQSELKPELVPYIQAIAAHCARWEHLKLLMPTLNHLLHFIPGPLDSLRSLTLGLWDEFESFKDPNPKIFTAPLLHRVALQQYYTVYDTVLPWSQLTVLIIDKVALDKCAVVLNRTPNLVQCRFSVHEAEDDLPTNIAPLLHLETFVLRSPWDLVDGLLSLLTLPSLRKFQVTEAFLRPNPIGTLNSLMSRSGCKPQKIRIISPRYPLQRYHQTMPSVKFTLCSEASIRDLFFVEEEHVWEDSEAELLAGDEDYDEDGSEVPDDAGYQRDSD